MNIKVYVKSLFIIYRYNKMKETLRIMKNNLKSLGRTDSSLLIVSEIKEILYGKH